MRLPQAPTTPAGEPLRLVALRIINRHRRLRVELTWRGPNDLTRHIERECKRIDEDLDLLLRRIDEMASAADLVPIGEIGRHGLLRCYGEVRP